MTPPQTQQIFGSAVRWAYATKWSAQLAAALTTFVVAALLGPENYGLVAIAVAYVAAISIFVDQGFVAALIQRKTLCNAHLNSVFWLLVCLTGFLCLISLGFREWWAVKNELPQLGPVIGLLSINIPLMGVRKVQEALLKRDLNFRALALRSVCAMLASGLVGIAMAVLGFGVWALVAQHLVRETLASALMWKLSAWRPSLQFSPKAIRDLIPFSVPSFLAHLGLFASNQADTIVVGLFFGPVVAGLYKIGGRMVDMVLEIVSRSLQTVSFPDFCRVQDNHDELRRMILSYFHMSMSVTVPAMALLAVLGTDLVLLLGDKWALAGQVVKVFCIWGCFQAFTQFLSPYLQSIGKPLALAILLWTQGAASVLVFWMFGEKLAEGDVETQLVWMAAAKVVLALAFVLPVLFVVLTRNLRLSPLEILNRCWPSILVAGWLVVVSIFVSSPSSSSEFNALVFLALKVGLLCVSGAGLLLLADRQLRDSFRAAVSFLGRRCWRS